MDLYTYDFEMQTMSTMFMDAFADLVINRFDVNKNPKDRIRARIVYAPKQRVLNDLLNRDQNLQLPVVAVSIGGVARNESRVFNKLQGTYYTPTNSLASIHDKSPLPVDITYNVSIMTRFQQDMDQILTHLLPYVNPYFVISWRTPNRPDHEIRSKVMWGGSVNIQYPTDLNANQTARVVADISFTFQGWLFQVLESVPNIYTFNVSYINTGNVPFDTATNLDKYLLSSLDSTSVDNVIYDAAPPCPKFVEPTYIRANSLQEVSVWGTGFETVTNVYLSGIPVSSVSTIQDPFSATLDLSLEFPAFNAFKINPLDWTLDKSENALVFKTIPLTAINTQGTIDIIVENPRGYGKLTENVPINTFNPYDEGNPLRDSWVYVQLPYVSGLQVF